MLRLACRQKRRERPRVALITSAEGEIFKFRRVGTISIGRSARKKSGEELSRHGHEFAGAIPFHPGSNGTAPSDAQK